jgi:hypothetical protein
MFRILSIALMLVFSGIATAKPKIALREATRLAETYIAQHKIPNSDRYLASVTWHGDLENPEESCWIVFWAPNEPGLVDAQLVVWVYDNGKIRYQDSWAYNSLKPMPLFGAT